MKDKGCPNCGERFNVPEGEGGPYRCPKCRVQLWVRRGIFWPMADEDASPQQQGG